MRQSRGLRKDKNKRTIARLGAMALAVALCLLVAAPASAARLVGKDGKVYACYKIRGKAKGNVRLVTKKAKCRKGEKKVSWNAAGQHGSAGENGENGGGQNGEAGGPGATGVAGLENRVTALTSKLTALEGVLKGITNTDLTGLLTKLQGISGTQLQDAVKSVANVNALTTQVSALCTQGKALTKQTQGLGSALDAAEVIGGLGFSLLVPNLPTALPDFSCP
jgi:hypothetical protein